MNLYQTDKEFLDFFDEFAFNEVANEETAQLDPKTKYLAVLASLLGTSSFDYFKVIVPKALEAGLTPVQVKEVIYQAAAYLGMGRAYPFITAANEVFESLNIELPLESQSTTTKETRLEKGVECQVKIFGPNMKDFYKASAMNRFLAGNCFGDYYTRGGLNLQERELITFFFLIAQGDAESQVTAHTYGNMSQGNGKDVLLKAIIQCVPFIGYPRSLNAIAIVNKVYDNLPK